MGRLAPSAKSATWNSSRPNAVRRTPLARTVGAGANDRLGGTMVLIQLLLPGPKAAGPADMTSLADTRRELASRFSGVTAYVRSPAKGLWTSPDGHTETDDVVMVEVVTETFDRRWWRTYAASLAKRFHQDAIHVRAMPVEVLDDDAV